MTDLHDMECTCEEPGIIGSRVVDTYKARERHTKTSYVRRRRTCGVCGGRFTTVEAVAPREMSSQGFATRIIAGTNDVVVKVDELYELINELAEETWK